MLRVPQWAMTALAALIIAVLPLGASWADPGRGNGREDPPAHGREKEDEDQQEGHEQDQQKEEAPQADEAPQEDEAKQGSEEGTRPSEEQAQPTPSSRPSQSPSTRPADSNVTESSADVVDVSFSASPASIAAGETSTIQVVVTNPSTSSTGDVEILIDLPPHLQLVSSRPEASTGKTLRLLLDDVPPGETASASVVVVGVNAAHDRDPIRFAVAIDGETFDHELFLALVEADPSGLALSQTSPLLLQVGDSGPFSATLTNGTDTALRNVAVVTEIAAELDVVGVTPIEAADAVQTGASPRGEDIVWIFDSLDPGEEVDLTWTARAATPGDLQAGNTIQASVQGQPAASSTQDTYLGYVQGVRTDRSSAPAPVVEERVVTRLVPVSSEVAASVGGGILPLTGWSPALFGFGGVLLIALGALLLWVSRGSRSRRSVLVLVGAIMLVATACVSDGGPSNSADPDPQAVESASPDTGEDGGSEDDKEDEVLGLRVNKPKPTQGEEATETPPVGPQTAPEAVPEVVYEEVSEVVSVFVPPAELPLETLQARRGDNDLSFTWAPAGGDLQAASSRMLTAEATEELLVSLSSRGDRLQATVMVANLADDRRLLVQGRLALQIVSGGGRSSTLVSDPIDEVLEPGASTAADLAFSLPSGTYTATGTFLAD